MYLQRAAKEFMAQLVALLTCNLPVMGLNPIKAPVVSLSKKTLPKLLSTGWFKERIRA